MMSRKAILLTLLAVPLTLSSANSVDGCRGCSAGRQMVQCDYYVGRRGEAEKQPLCEAYARYIDVDGMSAKAAWYYLLAGKPEEALKAAERALKIGQNFAGEYAAFALLIRGKKKEARKAMADFVSKVGKPDYLEKDIAVLQRLYPDVVFRELLH